MPHLLVTISGHGLGHLAQTGPVLQALQRRRPDLRLTVVSTLPQSRLRERIGPALEPVTRALDFGFLMHYAFRIYHPGSSRPHHAINPHHPALAPLPRARPPRPSVVPVPPPGPPLPPV